MPTARGRIFAIVTLCFFISGMAGLVYQVAWARYLALFLGHTSYAVVAVLMAFMGGLAIGNAWFGVKADRSRRPLALYGWLEVAIGLYALLFPTYFSICDDLFIRIARTLQPGSAGTLALKFLFSFLTILLPTILMGATFPVLTKFATRALAELREKVAALYCVNSVGAVVGCLIADFWWLPTIGLEATVFGGAAMNFAAGIIAIGLSKRIEEGRIGIEPEPLQAVSAVEQFAPSELKLAIIGIGISGFCAMLYEVAWTRLLALVLGSSTHAFSLMLVTFITGIAVGSWIIYRWKSLRRTLDAFAYAELALAVTLFLSMFFYADLPYWFSRWAGVLNRQKMAYPLYELIQALICFAVMFVPTVCLGMTLPLVSRIATAELARTGRSVGTVFAVNTVGTVLGAIVTGLWLMPLLALPRTFAVGIILNAVVGWAILRRGRITVRQKIAAPIVGFAVLWLTGLVFNADWAQTFSVGLWRNTQPPPNHAQYRQVVAGMNVVFHRDGAGSTVTVVAQESQPNKPKLSLNVNGKTDASLGMDMATQLLMGHVPMLLHADPRNALVVGLGSGMSCSAVARHSAIESIDVVEISPDVVEAARFFGDFNDEVLNNPKLHVVTEDAKSFLKVGEKQYDIIISEPSNPWMAGVAGVFSHEYYQDCKARLKPGGIVAQWVQMYETSDEILNLVLRTFGSVFPYTSIWRPAAGDLIFVGTTQPLTVDMATLEKRFNDPLVRGDLERVEMAQLTVFLSREMISQQNGLFATVFDGPVHSDFFPILEYKAQEAFFAQFGVSRWYRFDEIYSTRPSTLLGLHLKQNKLTEADYKAFGRFFLDFRLPESDALRSVVLRWQSEQPQSTLPMELMAQVSDRVPTAELEALRLRPMAELLMKQAEKDPQPLRMYASYLMQMYRSQRSAFYVPPTEHLQSVLERLLETHPASQRVYRLHLAELAWDRGDDKKFFELANSGFDPDISKSGRITFAGDPDAPRNVLYRMAETFWRAGKLQDAANVCRQAHAQNYTGTDGLLDLTCRKIEAYANPAANTIGPRK